MGWMDKCLRTLGLRKTAQEHDLMTLVMAEISRQWPELPQQRIDDTQLQLGDEASGVFQLYLDNLYFEYQRNPEALPQMVHQRLQQLRELNSREQSGDTSAQWASQLRQVLKPQAFVDDVARISGGEAGLALLPFLDGLRWLFVLDRAEGMEFFSLAQQQQMGWSDEQLVTLAAGNLQQQLAQSGVRLSEIDSEGHGRIVRLELDGFYDASLLTLDGFWAQLDLGFSAAPAVLVLARDIVLVMDSADGDALAYARQLAHELIDSQPYPIDTRLMVRREAGWQWLLG